MKLQKFLSKIKSIVTKPRNVFIFLFVLILCGHFLHNGVYAKYISYQNKSYPNVYIGGVSSGDKTVVVIVNKLNNKFDQSTINLQFKKQAIKVNPRQVGMSINLEKIESIVENHEPSDILRPWFIKENYQLPLNATDNNRLDSVLKVFDNNNFKKPINANFYVGKNQVVINKSKSGFGIDTQKLAKSLNQHFLNKISSFTYRLETGKIEPKVRVVDIEHFNDDIISRVNKSHVIEARGKTYSPNQRIKSKWFRVKVADNKKELAINNSAVKKYINSVARKASAKPIHQITSKYLSGRKSKVTTKGVDGNSPINLDELTKMFISRLKSEQTHTGRMKFKTIAFNKITRTVNDQPKSKTITYDFTTWGSVKSSFSSFKSLVSRTLSDSRGWSKAGIKFVQVSSGGSFTIVLSEPAKVANASPVCDSYYSCRVGRYAIINDNRWNSATPSWNNAGGSLRDYQHMVLNHEVGHWLGFGHRYCTGSGQPAPVMQQQSISLQGCKFNPWPTSSEISAY